MGPRKHLQREGHRHRGRQGSLPLGPDERGQGRGRRRPQDHRQEQVRGRGSKRLVHSGSFTHSQIHTLHDVEKIQGDKP